MPLRCACRPPDSAFDVNVGAATVSSIFTTGGKKKRMCDREATRSPRCRGGTNSSPIVDDSSGSPDSSVSRGIESEDSEPPHATAAAIRQSGTALKVKQASSTTLTAHETTRVRRNLIVREIHIGTEVADLFIVFHKAIHGGHRT